MKILVAGGAGFIGSHTVVELVHGGYQPIIMDDFSNSEPSVLEGLRKILGAEVPCYEADCRDRGALRRILEQEHIQGVIHFAASKAVGESVENPLKYYDNNLGTTITLLQEMRDANVPMLVFSSSCTVYGQPEVLPVTEDTPVQPATSPYGNTKQVCEAIIRDTARAGQGLKAISLRYFNPVGAHPSGHIGELPRGVPSNLVPFITQTAAGLREQLTVFGHDYPTSDGTCIRDFIHVVDLARAHVAALNLLIERSMNSWHYDVFNVGTGQGNTVLETIRTFEEVTGQPLNYCLKERRTGDIASIFAEVTKSEQLLKWKAVSTLRDALRDAWNWQQVCTHPT